MSADRCDACTGDGGRGHTMRGACMGAPCPVCGDHRYTHPEGHPPACPGTVGSKPWWMSRDQYDADGGPCPCILDSGHEPPCVCSHTALTGGSTPNPAEATAQSA